jgi:hypothetical protein
MQGRNVSDDRFEVSDGFVSPDDPALFSGRDGAAALVARNPT